MEVGSVVSGMFVRVLQCSLEADLIPFLNVLKLKLANLEDLGWELDKIWNYNEIIKCVPGSEGLFDNKLQ